MQHDLLQLGGIDVDPREIWRQLIRVWICGPQRCSSISARRRTSALTSTTVGCDN
jgi:hypothetical protein